jgi:hypothetical protein
MLDDDPLILADYDSIGLSANLYWTLDRTGRHRLFIIVEAHQAAFRERRPRRVESSQPARAADKVRLLPRAPRDRLLGQARTVMRFGVGDAFIAQPSLQFLGILASAWQARR